MGFCKESSKTYLKFLNGLIGTLGLVMIAVGVYGLIEYKDILAEIHEYAVYGPIALGGVIFLVAFLGMFGALNQNKPALIIYWVLMTLVTIMVLVVGGLYLVYSGQLDDVSVGNSQALTGTIASRLNDFQLAIFEDCCFDSAEIILDCNSTSVSGDACVKDREYFDGVEIPEEVCKTLENVKVDVGGVKVGIVGSVANSTCADLSVFQSTISDYMKDNILPIGISLIVVASLLLLADLFTCVLICTNREDYDANYRRKVNEQNAGAITGTGQPGVKYV